MKNIYVQENLRNFKEKYALPQNEEYGNSKPKYRDNQVASLIRQG